MTTFIIIISIFICVMSQLHQQNYINNKTISVPQNEIRVEENN